MQDIHLLLAGVALGAVPSATLGRIMAAALAKRLGVNPREVAEYSDAADGDSDE
jgi:Zn-dependent M32 family carboxypeptidase